MVLHRDYPHLQFKTQWEISPKANFLLGQCEALISAINKTPIMPQHFKELMKIALIKGAQATTAIEGNTLSDEEIEKLVEGEKLPPSKEYQQKEVQNIIDALNNIFADLCKNDLDDLITPQLLLNFHRMVGKDLGEHFGAIPGHFRDSDVVVGHYRCPDHRDVPILIDRFCEWLQEEFSYRKKNQECWEIIIHAIVAHVYIEWIHPFSDGNGRTGRLVEFYILVRGELPNIASHILSNHYNLTRSEYYRQLQKASQTQSLTEFLEYALLGFKDGLDQTLKIIQESQLLNAWQKYIYDTFNEVKMVKRDVFKRRRTLALELPIDKTFSIAEIPELSIKLARLYSNISERTIMRDFEELLELHLIKKESGKYSVNIELLNAYIAFKRKKKANQSKP